jgi:hypothetical protein
MSRAGVVAIGGLVLLGALQYGTQRFCPLPSRTMGAVPAIGDVPRPPAASGVGAAVADLSHPRGISPSVDASRSPVP